MFLRATTRKKDGKTHRYWSVVENRRLPGGRVLQRHALYLGEINSSQERAWRRSVEVFDGCAGGATSLALFPDDRLDESAGDGAVVRLRLSQLRLHRPRVWGSCWLAQQLRPHAPGLTPRSVLDKFAAAQMLDVQIPTTDNRQLTLTRYTEPAPDLRLLLDKLPIELPAQPPPKITAAQAASVTSV